MDLIRLLDHQAPSMKQKRRDLCDLLDDAAATTIRERQLPSLRPIDTPSGLRYALDTGAALGIVVIRANGKVESD
jgi:hypothetical protein